MDAIRNYLAIRRKPRQQMHRDLVFTTVRGGPWSNPDSADCAIAKAFRRLTTTARVYRPGATFYTLRRTFRTIADRSKDQPACDVAMGHETAGMAAIYRQRIDDDRLEAVANIVHEWLYAGIFR